MAELLITGFEPLDYEILYKQFGKTYLGINNEKPSLPFQGKIYETRHVVNMVCSYGNKNAYNIPFLVDTGIILIHIICFFI